MKKASRVLSLALAAIMTAGAFSGCSSEKSTSQTASPSKASDSKTLTVYTARSEPLVKLVIPAFEKDTGIKVNTITAGTGELEKRIQSEKSNPMGDIFWGADVTMLSSIKDLFMPYTSPEDKNMPDEFKNKTGYFTPCFADPTVFIVNKNLAGSTKIEGFTDLINPALKGKIAFGDPVNSSSAFQQLVAMAYDIGNGDPMSDKAWKFIDKFIANLDGKILNSSGQVHKGVADGEYVVGLTWEDPAADYVKNGANVQVVFPKEGAVFPGESVQIINNCKNPDNAKKFVDYLLSEKLQDLVGTQLTVRPLRTNAKLASYMQSISTIKLTSKYDPNWISKNKTSLTAKWTEHLTKAQG